MYQIYRIPLYCRTAKNPWQPTEDDAYLFETVATREQAEKAISQLNGLADRCGDVHHHVIR